MEELENYQCLAVLAREMGWRSAGFSPQRVDVRLDVEVGVGCCGAGGGKRFPAGRVLRTEVRAPLRSNCLPICQNGTPFW